MGLHNALDSGVPLFLWFSEVGRGGGAIGQYLSFGDIAMNNQANPSDLQVSLKQSKTDPFRNGVKTKIGWAEGPLCLVVAALAYMALRGPGEGTLFRFQDSRFLTRQRLVAKLREMLQEVGLHPEKYAGQSFCIGTATTVAACGVQDSLIKTTGRWESIAYQLYVRTPQEQLGSYSCWSVLDIPLMGHWCLGGVR